MRILIAEDDITSRTMLAGVLRKYGHEVVETVDGEAAWEIMAREEAPRLAVLDLMMPRMDGLEVVRRIRAMDSKDPPYIIMLTTKAEKTDIAQGLDAGANDYLAKPFDAGELRARVAVGQRMLETQAALKEKIRELEIAAEHIKTLKGIIPICSGCKKIRDDRGYWTQVEEYVRDHTEAEFSHGLCPECLNSLYPEYKGKEDEGKGSGG